MVFIPEEVDMGECISLRISLRRVFITEVLNKGLDSLLVETKN